MPKKPKSAVETELKAKTEYGSLHPKKTLILREHVGTATLGELSYEMSVSLPQLSPTVQSGRTGKWFTIPWQHIVDMAVKAGIDEP